MKKDMSTFKDNFSQYINKKIVLYGIGLKTQDILENNGFNFIGLMDRDPENVGKKIYGLPVLNYEEVIKSADLIVIVSGNVYFQTIFSRIEFLQKKHGIPIYFCDGTKGEHYKKNLEIDQNPYWEKNLETLKSEINKFEIVSFDIFDTLITRRLTEPVNLIQLIARRIGEDVGFVRNRIKTELALGAGATITNIYKNMPGEYEDTGGLEEKLERSYCIARGDMIRAYQYALSQNKTVYLISDICHHKEFLVELLENIGITGYEDIFVSSELKKRKSDKELWAYFQLITDGKRVLHIGDNPICDIRNAKIFGIDTCHILSPYEMLKNSTLKGIAPQICSWDDSVIMGNIISKIFNSPFALSKTRGQPFFNRFEDLGYVYYAPVLFTYLVWIIKKTLQNKENKILFVARDGYFLEKLYNLLIHRLNIKRAPQAAYLMISRPLITILNLKEDTIEDTLKMKFNGKASDYFKIRFGIDLNEKGDINTAADKDRIKKIVNENKILILNNAQMLRKRYRKYLYRIIKSSDRIALVDPSYNGTSRYFLSRLLNKKITGYYCYANLSYNNPYYTDGTMLALYQTEDDHKAEKSNLRRNTIFFEDGILVAPTGICLTIDEDLRFKYSPLGNTQKMFDKKEKIFEGIVEFFDHALVNYEHINEINISPQFIDFIVGEIYGENCIIDDRVKNTFFVDTMFETVYDRKIFE